MILGLGVREYWGFPIIRGTLSGGPYNKDCSILGVYIGVPLFWETTVLFRRPCVFCPRSGCVAWSVEVGLRELASCRTVVRSVVSGQSPFSFFSGLAVIPGKFPVGWLVCPFFLKS